ncbi:extensin family protein [Hartmannibacter diazotrophicus]|nr:extensin family protein [Hartmannibacter diazotrophicus]
MATRYPVPITRAIVLASLLPMLSACGFFDFEERDPWREQAEAACYARKEVTPSAVAVPMKEIDGPGICGVRKPLKVNASLGGAVEITPPATLDCPMTAAIGRWLDTVVQPAAWERYGAPVVSIKNVASYGCRTRNHKRGEKLSEHAFANALDIAAFTLANGYTVTVKSGWRGSEADRAFLRQVHYGACGPFKTVLGPGTSDGMHEEHFHLDLAKHNAKYSAYCRPTPVEPPPAEPRIYQASPGSVPNMSTVPVASLGAPATDPVLSNNPEAPPDFSRTAIQQPVFRQPSDQQPATTGRQQPRMQPQTAPQRQTIDPADVYHGRQNDGYGQPVYQTQPSYPPPQPVPQPAAGYGTAPRPVPSPTFGFGTSPLPPAPVPSGPIPPANIGPPSLVWQRGPQAAIMGDVTGSIR